MFSKLKTKLFSKLGTKLISTLVTTETLVWTDANVWKLQASVNTITERDFKLRADYYGQFPTSDPSSLSPSAMGNKTPMGQLDLRLADLHLLLDSCLFPVTSLHKVAHSALRLRSNPSFAWLGPPFPPWNGNSISFLSTSRIWVPTSKRPAPPHWDLQRRLSQWPPLGMLRLLLPALHPMLPLLQLALLVWTALRMPPCPPQNAGRMLIHQVSALTPDKGSPLLQVLLLPINILPWVDHPQSVFR